MKTFVVGDVHGCLVSLKKLWKQIDFDLRRDRLWLTGDLVHRGPDSAGVVRWAREREDQLGDRFSCVLGNHDLLLLAVAEGLVAPRAKDHSEQLLKQPDADQLLDWLLLRPLIHRDRRTVLVHAGLSPKWSISEAEEAGHRAEKMLRSKRRAELLRAIHGGRTDDPRVRKRARDAQILTRIRTCTPRGVMARYSGPPKGAPSGFRAWFEHRKRAKTHIVFGHWAALGLHRGRGVTCLDSGCAWGRRLSALELSSEAVTQQACLDQISSAGP